MRNLYKYTITTLLACLIFYGGGGVNFVSYCCDNCRSGRIEATVAANCCNCCSDHSSDTSCCDIERITFEWNNVQNPEVEIHPVASDLFFSGNYMPHTMLPIVSAYTKTLFTQYDDPPIASNSRFYLSLFATLLI